MGSHQSGEPGENPCKHEKNIQTPTQKGRGWGSIAAPPHLHLITFLYLLALITISFSLKYTRLSGQLPPFVAETIRIIVMLESLLRSVSESHGRVLETCGNFYLKTRNNVLVMD